MGQAGSESKWFFWEKVWGIMLYWANLRKVEDIWGLLGTFEKHWGDWEENWGDLSLVLLLLLFCVDLDTTRHRHQQGCWVYLKMIGCVWYLLWQRECYTFGRAAAWRWRGLDQHACNPVGAPVIRQSSNPGPLHHRGGVGWCLSAVCAECLRPVFSLNV